MTTSQLTDLTCDILVDQLGINPAEFSTDKTFSDYGADSLDDIEIIMAFEESLDMSIDDEDAERLAKLPVSETILWLESQLAQ